MSTVRVSLNIPPAGRGFFIVTLIDFPLDIVFAQL